MPDTRPVWLTESQAASLIHGGTGFSDTRYAIWKQWNAAPADAKTEAARALLSTERYDVQQRGHRIEAFAAARSVLRALGMPGEWPMPKPPPYPADDENDDA